MAVQNGLAYKEIGDEIIADYKIGIENFVKSQEYWRPFCQVVSVPNGHEKFTYRRLIKPLVHKDEVKTSAEYVAPRPTKFAVETFEKGIANYRDKFVYSKEDLMYHFDDTVQSGRATLQEIVRQKRDFIFGAPFFASKCTMSAVQVSGSDNVLATLKKAAVILRKNKAKRWDGKHYLAHITPEIKQTLLAEIEAKGSSLSAPVKMKLAEREIDFDTYGDWMFSDTIDTQMYKSSTVQYMVLMGRRDIDNASPITISRMAGESEFELINRGLGSGVLEDEDGNITADDNNQRGAIAINMMGMGAAVNDDLCVIDVEFTVNEIEKSQLLESEKTNFKSISGAEVEISLTSAGTLGTTEEFVLTGVRHDSTANKDYANKSTILKAQIKAKSGYAFSGSGSVSPSAAGWSVKYRNKYNGTQYDAKIIACVKTDVDYDTILVEVPANCYDFAVATTAKAVAE